MLIKQPDRPDNISANANCYASRKECMSYLDCLQSFSAADERSFPADIKTIFQQANRPVSGEENGYEHGKKFMNSITLHTRWLTQPAVHCVPPGRRSLGWVWWRTEFLSMCSLFTQFLHSAIILTLFLAPFPFYTNHNNSDFLGLAWFSQKLRYSSGRVVWTEDHAFLFPVVHITKFSSSVKRMGKPKKGSKKKAEDDW